MTDVSTFKRIVRPSRVLALKEAESFASFPTEDPVLVHGGDVDVFSRVAPHVGWGSAFVLVGASSESAARMEQSMRENSFHAWYRGAEMPGFSPDDCSWVKHAGGGYGSHLDVLTEAVRRTSGAVLELGAGDASTPALHKLCADSGRLLVTVDNDEGWLDRFRHLERPGHAFDRVNDPAESLWLDEVWSVVLVDHAPGHTRGTAIERVRKFAEYVVVHDTEELGYGIEDLLSTFRHRTDFRRSRPWTTVASDFKEVW